MTQRCFLSWEDPALGTVPRSCLNPEMMTLPIRADIFLGCAVLKYNRLKHVIAPCYTTILGEQQYPTLYPTIIICSESFHIIIHTILGGVDDVVGFRTHLLLE